MSLDGCYCELFYKGITQRIYNAKNDYDELYKLFVTASDLAPAFIDVKSQISGISEAIDDF